MHAGSSTPSHPQQGQQGQPQEGAAGPAAASTPPGSPWGRSPGQLSLLNSLKIMSPAGSQLAAELAALEENESDEEGEGEGELKCMVCREGYRLQPSNLLCVYCFCKPLSSSSSSSAQHEGPGLPPPGGAPAMLLPPGPSPCAAAFCTVTHFNAIHASCHAAARAADASLRQPKREWEGAALRNGEVGGGRWCSRVLWRAPVCC